MRDRLDQHFHAVPDQVAADKRRLADVDKKVELLLNDLEDPIARQSDGLKRRLAHREAEAAELRRAIEEAEQAFTASVELPDEAWIHAQLKDLVALFRDDKTHSARLLRRLIGTIEASAVVAPGKKRGYARLTFRVRPWDVLLVALEGKIPQRVAETLRVAGDSTDSPEFVIDLGRPTRMEEWAPKIAELREKGVPWTEIARIAGMGLGPAYQAWKRYVDATQPRKETEGQAG